MVYVKGLLRRHCSRAVRLERVVLQTDEPHLLGKFTVVVGGNGVGKSTLLREIFHKVTRGQERRWRWVKELSVREDEPRKAAKLLLDSLDEVFDRGAGTTNFYQSRGSKNYQGGFDNDSRIDRARYEALQSIVDGADAEALTLDPLLRKPFFAYYGPEQRLSVPQEAQVQAIDQPPTDVLNALWRKPELMEKLTTRIRTEFRTELLLLDHRGATLEFGVADEALPDSDNEKDLQKRLRLVEMWKKEHNFSPIGETGHGMRAMVNILLGVFEPVNQVLLVDEPELHLYPTQKRNLARHLVELSKDAAKQVIVVTHDATFLQGVLDTASDATVLRLSFGDKRKTRHIRRCVIRKDGEFGPTKNQREYLNALFYERVLIVEGAGDRTFYQGIAEIEQLGRGEDIGLIVSSGKAGALNIAKLCKDVGVPYGIIFDFDCLLKAEFSVVEKAIGISGVKVESIAISRTVDEVEREVAAACEVRSERTKHSKVLKAHGIGAQGIGNETKEQLRRALNALEQAHIFVVPIGELESWCPPMAEEKARFAERALDHLESRPSERAAVKAFLAQAYTSLSKQLPPPPPEVPSVVIR